MITKKFDTQGIKLDGLTIIAGLNNSGKTTISKNVAHDKREDHRGIKLDFFSLKDLSRGSGIYPNKHLIIFDEVDRKFDQKNVIKFAEMICKDVKAGTRFFITTFNPDFLKALNYYSEQYKIKDITNYYKTEIINGEIIVTDKTQQLNELYVLLTSDI